MVPTESVVGPPARALKRSHDDMSRLVPWEEALLTGWATYKEEPINLGETIYLEECVDLRAAKFLMSLNDEAFRNLYITRAVAKLEEANSKLKKDGEAQAIKRKDIEQMVKTDRAHLRAFVVEFVKHKGVVRRSYTFKAPKQFGRRFAQGGMQGLWGAFKACLTRPVCSDFDMVNAHPTILLWVCDTLKIRCVKLRDYVRERERILAEMMTATEFDRAHCKQLFLVSTNEAKHMPPTRYPFFNEFDREMKSIHAALVAHDNYRWVHKHMRAQTENYNGSFVNLIMCFWENVLLEYAIEYFRRNSVDVRVLMFDGCMVSTKDKEGQIIPLTASECTDHCKKLAVIAKHVLGIDLQWTVKPLDDSRVQVPAHFDPKSLLLLFEELVESFDARNKKVGENYVTICDDGTFAIRTKQKFADYHNHIRTFGPSSASGGVSTKFVFQWLEQYDKIPYFEKALEYPPGGPPERSKCPDEHFNVWEPFAFQRWDPKVNPDGSRFVRNPRAVELFQTMVLGLVGDDQQNFQWFMQWLYTCLVFPATKSGRCPFLISKQGCGKDTLVQILQTIFGTMRCVTEPDPANNIWGQFNEVLLGTYLVVLTEVGVSAFTDGLGKVKHLITGYEYTLNIKSGAKIKKMSSFHRFMGITNVGSSGEITPVPVGADERRFVLFRASDRLKGDHAFWCEMHTLIADLSAVRSILEYMLTFEHQPTFADIEVPVTEFQRTAVARHPIEQFIAEYANATPFNGVSTITCDNLWEEYKSWSRLSNVSLGNMTKEHFGKKLTRFNFTGVGPSKSVRNESGGVSRGRELDYAKLKEAFKLDEADEAQSEAPEAQVEVREAQFEAEEPPAGSRVVVANVRGTWLNGPTQAALARDAEFKRVDFVTFRSAGVILYNKHGYWLGLQRSKGAQHWVDYGGERRGGEVAWETAVRECRERAGVDVESCVLHRKADFHCESQAKHVVFWVETDSAPLLNHHPDMLRHQQFRTWPGTELHPRLLYDKGFVLRASRQELGFES